MVNNTCWSKNKSHVPNYDFRGRKRPETPVKIKLQKIAVPVEHERFKNGSKMLTWNEQNIILNRPSKTSIYPGWRIINT